ncbi:hypothetical protein [Solicola sp. PLA-1-18]|uniref:hypothetical protein n=1 Tax=Solicola sp. PLA-1-18 TaxID=3380532 RepID=UPI003B7A9598
MTPSDSLSAGIVLLTVVAIESGGVLLLRIATGGTRVNELQRTFFRAGHAHAGMFVTLGLVVLLLVNVADVASPWRDLGPTLVLSAAIVMPAGFFLSVIGRDPQAPNRLRLLLPAGGVVLAVGLVVSAVGLIGAGVAA